MKRRNWLAAVIASAMSAVGIKSASSAEPAEPPNEEVYGVMMAEIEVRCRAIRELLVAVSDANELSGPDETLLEIALDQAGRIEWTVEFYRDRFSSKGKS